MTTSIVIKYITSRLQQKAMPVFWAQESGSSSGSYSGSSGFAAALAARALIAASLPKLYTGPMSSCIALLVRHGNLTRS
eukprot:CAMPEP_0172914720 /NCGR_PEP_ID=MMETSP1075-20121228/192911_1 /TAXON_ID=2916 /ORGANISM="Ceratium fusus, Strain PA161109" /LENGTH=78 /DNA_ID=CAMNT_0013773673 /DNA_START=294 /DNA_END=527 /DNA_ORIENTATION=+